MKKIVLITSGQPSSNPRLVKEANTLIQSGYEVTVLYQYYTAWATEADVKLLEQVKWNYKLCGGSPHKNKTIYLINRIRLKLNSIVKNCLGINIYSPEKSVCPSYDELFKQAIKLKADFYIGHNLAALPIAVNAAKKNGVKCGFDAEDFHRFEENDNVDDKTTQLKIAIENRYIPQLNYCSAASPLIAQAYKKLYPNLNPLVINNVFESKHQKPLLVKDSDSLKLFWFSQTIGPNRGLEAVITAINSIGDQCIELHLLGNLNEENEMYFNTLANFKINYIKPVEPDAIFEIASTMDIGLALELNVPYNRDICLTNKIFTYLISGLAIIASETQAQKLFMQENLNIGLTYPIGQIESLIQCIKYYLNDKDALKKDKVNAWQLAKDKYNWENEEIIFLKQLKSTL